MKEITLKDLFDLIENADEDFLIQVEMEEANTDESGQAKQSTNE